MWVVLEHHNEYYQNGGYFAGVYTTEEKAVNDYGVSGRIDDEQVWYTIEFVEINKMFEQGS